MNRKKPLDLAFAKLGKEFAALDLTFHKMEHGQKDDLTSYWPGNEDENVMVCVFKGKEIHEPFHRQDFFFLNYAYLGSYDALSAKYNNLITIAEGDCYIGQPYSGYALRGKSLRDIIIIGLLIRRDAFFRDCLPIIYMDAALFRFFIEPKTNSFSDEHIHLAAQSCQTIRSLLELMVMEYADRREDTQRFLKAMLQPLLLEIARQHIAKKEMAATPTLSERIVEYMDNHSDVVALKDIAAHFSYHPNYISAILRKETGRTFTDILREKRMERAVLLLQNTALSIEEISPLVGYSDISNFYRAFKSYYGHTPREQLGSLFTPCLPNDRLNMTRQTPFS